MFDRTKKVVHGIGVCAGVLVAGAMLAMAVPDRVEARNCQYEVCDVMSDDCKVSHFARNCTVGETDCEEERC